MLDSQVPGADHRSAGARSGSPGAEPTSCHRPDEGLAWRVHLGEYTSASAPRRETLDTRRLVAEVIYPDAERADLLDDLADGFDREVSFGSQAR
jgi:hypothetical protein